MLLGIDIGTTHTKVGVYAKDGRLLSHRQAPTPLITGADGLSYFALAGIWETATALLRQATQEAAGIVEGVAVASMGEAGVTLDANGEPTYPVIPWYDARASAQMAALSTLAAPVPPGESPIFIAQFRGAAPPINDPQASGAFLDVTPEHRPEHMARAVYEGVAFEVRAGLELFEQVTATPISVVRMVGGGSLDPLWPRIRAAVLQRPLEIARYPDMVTLGAALLAGLGAGIYHSPQQAVTVTYQPRQHFYPDPAWLKRYAPLYPRYLAAAQSLRRWRRELP